MNETLSAKELASEAKRAYQSGDFAAAARSFDAAAQAYQAAGDLLNAAEMSNNSSVAYLQSGDGQAALQAVEGTPTKFALAGDTRRQALALGNLGAALEALDRIKEAADAYRESGELLKQLGENDMRLYVMQSLSALQMRSGHQVEALASMESGLDEIEHPTPKQALLKRLLKVPFKLLGRSD